MTDYRKMAALGSSYAAGPGISPVVNRPAMRSGMVGAATSPFDDVPFDAATIQALTILHEQLTEVFADAAQHTQADLIEASKLGKGHELGTAEPWIQPLHPPHRLPSSFHPTAAGMKAVGDAISRHIGV